MSGVSFAGDVKAELCRPEPSRRCCAQAEVYGALLFCHTFNSQEVRIVTECAPFARRLPKLFKKAFHMNVEPVAEGEGKLVFALTDPAALGTIARAYGIERGTLANHINFAVLEESCCRSAFFRGAFLAGGSVTDPRKGYHLELGTTHLHVSREALVLLDELGLEAKQVRRKSNYITYFKRSSSIEDFLTLIGAPLASMEVMNAKLEKGLRGSVNRRVNCDTANVDKVVEAARVQIGAIRRLEEAGALSVLPDKLRRAAALRLEYPEDTLAQLAQRWEEPCTKSALNHRLRKLVELARGLDQ